MSHHHFIFNDLRFDLVWHSRLTWCYISGIRLTIPCTFVSAKIQMKLAKPYRIACWRGCWSRSFPDPRRWPERTALLRGPSSDDLLVFRQSNAVQAAAWWVTHANSLGKTEKERDNLHVVVLSRVRWCAHVCMFAYVFVGTRARVCVSAVVVASKGWGGEGEAGVVSTIFGIPARLLHFHLSPNRRGRWGTTDDFTTSDLQFSLFPTALRDLANSRPVHSLMLSSRLFFCLPCLLPLFAVPCKMVLARPDERET